VGPDQARSDQAAPTRWPTGWGLEWREEGDPVSPGVLALATSAERPSIALAVLEQGRAALGEGPTSGPVRVAVRPLPVLDDVVALWMLARREAGAAPTPAWRHLASYAEACRLGYAQDGVRPERAVQAVYRALARRHLDQRPPRRDAFVTEAFALLDAVRHKLDSGRSILGDDLLSDETRFKVDLDALDRDLVLYREDSARARRFLARLPPAATRGVVRPPFPLLAVARPVAVDFKQWARRDSAAPGGEGYPLLVVERAERVITLSADPTRRIELGWLKTALDRRESEARGGALPAGGWYDGSRHGRTLVESPHGGTALSLDDVLAVLRGATGLRPVRVRAWTRPAAAATLAAVAAAALVAIGLRSLHPRPAPPDAPEIAQRGRPYASGQLLQLTAEIRGMTHYAVIAGVCSYGSEWRLEWTCSDARQLAKLLVDHYGYRRENVLLLVDDPDQGRRPLGAADGPPTKQGIESAIGEVADRIRQRDPGGKNSTFLFYYSGHGNQDRGLGKASDAFYGAAKGWLAPAGYDPQSHPDKGRMTWGYDMQNLRNDIRNVLTPHRIVLLDCCHSGYAGANVVLKKAAREWETRVMSLWSSEQEVVLTAGTDQQTAQEIRRERAEVGHGLFTEALLEALDPAQLRADTCADGVVTDEELAKYVQEAVERKVKEIGERAVRDRSRSNVTPQTPMYVRTEPQGQFLFVPARWEPREARCSGPAGQAR
jgi:uncharacterized caspase-like protein